MKQLLGIIVIMLLFGCTEKTTSHVPDDLIPQKEFIALLIDLEIMEAYYEQVHKRPQLYKTTVDSASRLILAEKGISEKQLENTLEYYSSMPDTLYNLYEIALDSINSMVNKNKNMVQ
ncbi:MAG: DUF4296 domain-containing protein [Crocinitomicaceae bacterium]